MRVSPISFFVHPSLREDADRLLRVRILIAVLLTLVVQESAVMVVLLVKFPANAILFGGSLTLLSIATSIALLIMLRSFACYVFCSFAAPLITLLLIAAGIAVSGGLPDSPVTQLLVAPVLMAFFFGGIRGGGITVAVVLSIVALFLLLSYNGIDFPQTVNASVEEMGRTRLLITAINFTFICGMTLAYEYTARGLRRERDDEHDKYVRLAKVDPLTGLPNRRNFDAILQDCMHRYGASEPLRQFVLGYMDLNGFKPINDRYGHAIGDEVLCIVSDRLRGALRDSEFVGRYGGDEFMLILDAHASATSIEAVALRLLDIIGQPIITSKGRVEVGASIGFAVFRADNGDIDSLKQAADVAMYEAKRSRTGWCIYGLELKAPTPT